MIDSQTIGQALFIAVVAGVAVINHFKGREREPKLHAHLDQKFTEQRQYIDERFTTIEKEVMEIRHFCVGPDDQNGFRGDIREIKTRVMALEDRERARLEPRDVGRLDRRGA